ncbi:hypothetical protein GCM10027046_34670 [Uliginosibacterium flavum]
MLLASSQSFAASRAEAGLSLDAQLHATDPDAPLPLVQFDLIEDDAPLRISPAIPPAELPTLSGDTNTSATGRPSSAPTLRDHLESLLRALWLLTALLLGLHMLREWVRVMRVRVRRPARSIAMEHAPWPTVSILIPARGSPGAQSRQLDELHSCFFDYPVERIHFVPMFDPADAEIIPAVARLTQAFPGRVHPLPMMDGRNTTLAAALHAAVATSIGSALIVLDQDAPLPQAWLRQSVTPLLDPATGAVLSRAIPAQTESALSARLNLLGDQADTLIAAQSDALSLLLCGKARIRALRRQAVKSLETPDLQHAPDGAGIVLGLTRMGWQSQLLGEIVQCTADDAPDLIRSPRLRISIALRSMRMASLLLNPRIPLGARLQGGAAFFSAALPLIWLASLLSGIALYFVGAPLSAGLAMALCAATSFDPHGQPSPAFSMAAAARMAGIRTEIRLLPLSCFSFIDRLIDGLHILLRARREHPGPPTAGHPSIALQPDREAAT